MNEEEKNAIENIKALKILFEIDDKKDFEATPSVQKEIAKDLKTTLNLIEKLQKENEELKEYNMTYKRILGLADNRIYRKKYLEERRKEQPNLLYPDSDEIYRRYYELKEENEHLHREINRRIKLKIENKKIVDTQLKVLHELLDESEENKCGTN